MGTSPGRGDPLILAALRVRSTTNDSWPVGAWIATDDEREPVLGFGRMSPWKTASYPEMMSASDAAWALEDLTKRYGHCATFAIVKFREIVDP